MPAILAGLAASAVAGAWLLSRTGLVQLWLEASAAGAWRGVLAARGLVAGADAASDSAARRGRLLSCGLVAAAAGAVLALDSQRAPAFANAYNAELARNGLWSLFAAFRNNELDYPQFYARLPDDEAFAFIQNELAQDGSAPLASTHAARDTLRFVASPGPELRPNVIQITVESLSAEFLGALNPASALTPNLDALARDSLVFENFYATGNRTDRGMEALSLSLPPTPGRSLVKRPANAGLFTLGSLFRGRGYDTAFIYGGYGYFDNMNAFFGGNGYRVIDRASVSKNDVTFANAWGACDGDLLRWTLREADACAASGKPFHFFVMTTSNHRPYTYPAGLIDLPPKISGRAGAVKYTDHAIGGFMRAAAQKPWFKDTVFVIVADHCAGSAGKAGLPVEKYHIPLIIHAPGGQIAPGRVTQLASQIDFAPTLLGLLGWSYATRFYGWDVLSARGDRRALIGNYQKLGLHEPGTLTVLSPLRGVAHYNYDRATHALSAAPPDEFLRAETIAYYQTAAWLYRHGRYRAISEDEQTRLRAQHAARSGAPANVGQAFLPVPPGAGQTRQAGMPVLHSQGNANITARQ
jgi:phosphoglycerol transferase MdoB-like AlkP superfamily enzyme